MKKILAVIVAVLFVLSVTGLCFAQAAAPAKPADTKAAPAVEKKADVKKVDDKATKKAEKKAKPAKKAAPKKAEKKAEPKKEAPKAEEKKAEPAKK